MKLLPCPFCGFEAGIFRVSIGELEGTWFINCQNQNEDYCYLTMIDDDDLPHFYQKEDAIEAWNKRDGVLSLLTNYWYLRNI